MSCVGGVVTSVQNNVATLAKDLEAAGGKGIPLIGITYPDVFLGEWVYKPPNQTLATESVTAFQSLVNPALLAAYTAAGGGFVDVTAATGAYTPLSKTTTLKPYGKIPVAVADVCTLTWFCSVTGDIHPKTPGYAVIAKLIETEYKTLHP